MHYSHSIIEHAIEDFEGVANERCDVQGRPLFDLGRATRLAADAVNYRADARFQSFRYSVTEHPAAVWQRSREGR